MGEKRAKGSYRLVDTRRGDEPGGHVGAGGHGCLGGAGGAHHVGGERRRGRGASSNAASRYDALTTTACDDGWEGLADLPPFKTEVERETAKSIIATNKSPDISFDQSINPYRGCEHGCIYCYARPTHAYLGHSPGLDFETKLTAKVNAAELLEAALAKPSYKVSPIALGAVTDPYQPIERDYKLTRQILEVLSKAQHPFTIVTKSALVLRDVDLLQPLAAKGLCKVALSITSLDANLSRRMEPRASAPHRRLEALRQLDGLGIPTMVMMAPVIPGLNDHEIESVLEAVAEAGAGEAGYVLLRLPLEIKTLFREWLAREVPERASRVISLMQSTRGGQDYDTRWGVRQRGEGPFAALIEQRFRLARKRLGLELRRNDLRCDLFVKPVAKGGQMSLF